MKAAPQLLSSKVTKIGRLFSNTKISYEWEVIADQQALKFCFTDSKSSAIKRLFLNETEVLSEKSRATDYSIRLVFNEHEFLIFQENDLYRMKIDGGFLNDVPTSVKSIPTIPSFKDLPKLGDFKVERENGSLKISGGNSVRTTSQVSTLPDEFPHNCKSPKTLIPKFLEQASNPARPVFESLNDSGEFYTHNHHFMMIKEPLENIETVRIVNMGKAERF